MSARKLSEAASALARGREFRETEQTCTECGRSFMAYRKAQCSVACYLKNWRKRRKEAV
jgi:hypothetical protein